MKAILDYILKKIIFGYWSFQREQAHNFQILFEIIDLEVQWPLNDIETHLQSLHSRGFSDSKCHESYD